MMHIACVVLLAGFARTYGWDNFEMGQYITEAPDGSILLLGHTTSWGAGADLLLIKMAPDGSPLWTKVYSTPDNDWGLGIDITPDNNIVLASESGPSGNADVIVMKVSLADGSVIWAKKYIGGDWDGPRSLKTVSDGFIVAGWTESASGEDDFYLIKIDPNGNLVWAKVYGGPIFAEEDAYPVIQTRDGGFLIGGWTQSFGAGGRDIFLVKTDPLGNTQWAKTYGGPLGDSAYAILEMEDGTFIVAGQTSNFGASGTDIFVMRLGLDGFPLWSRIYGENGYEYIYSADRTADGVIMAGYTTSTGALGKDALIMKIDPSGNLIWASLFGGVGNEEAWSIRVSASGNPICTGYTTSWGTGTDAFALSLNPDGTYQGCLRNMAFSTSLVNPTVMDQTTGVGFTPTVVDQTLNQSEPVPNFSDPCASISLEEREASPWIRAILTDGAVVFLSAVDSRVEIYSPDGRLFLSQELHPGQTRISLEPGVYFWHAGQFKGKAVVR